MKPLSDLWGMSTSQLENYFTKHSKEFDKLYNRMLEENKESKETKLLGGLHGNIKILRAMYSKIKDVHESEINRLNKRINDLEGRLNLTPENSHKPPSSNTYKKIKNSRKKTNKKHGGQIGHQGVEPELVDTPDDVVEYAPLKCRSCGENLKSVQISKIDRYQEVDIKKGQQFITEHQRITKFCPVCDDMNRGEFPNEALWKRAKKTFGPMVKSVAVYFNCYQMLPFARTQEIFSDLFGLKVSQGSLCNFITEFSKGLSDWEISLKSQLIHSPVLNTDETGIRCAGNVDWVHVVSSDQLTLLAHSSTRGSQAQDTLGVLPDFKGNLIHDGFKSYDKYDQCKHYYCNAHILRELKYLYEEDSQQWAFELSKFLKKTLKLSKSKKSLKKKSSNLYRKYLKILKRGFIENGYGHEFKGRPPDGYKEGVDEKGRPIKIPQFKRRKLSKAMNLLIRLRDYKKGFLGFAFDKNIPFTNNQAERDLRMLKVKQKISGCFRSPFIAKHFMRIKSFISTLKKQDLPVIDNIYFAQVLTL